MKALLLVILLSSGVHARYRAYKLGVKYVPEQPKELEVLTSLDDQQYLTYYKYTNSQQVRIIEHWMCYDDKRLDFKPICPNPNLARQPASTPPPVAPKL